MTMCNAIGADTLTSTSNHFNFNTHTLADPGFHLTEGGRNFVNSGGGGG